MHSVIEQDLVDADPNVPADLKDMVRASVEEAVSRAAALGLALAPGYVSEINLRLGPWIAELGNLLEKVDILAIHKVGFVEQPHLIEY